MELDHLLRLLYDDPTDDLLRFAFCDRLEEMGLLDKADLIRMYRPTVTVRIGGSFREITPTNVFAFQGMGRISAISLVNLSSVFSSHTVARTNRGEAFNVMVPPSGTFTRYTPETDSVTSVTIHLQSCTRVKFFLNSKLSRYKTVIVSGTLVDTAILWRERLSELFPELPTLTDVDFTSQNG